MKSCEQVLVLGSPETLVNDASAIEHSLPQTRAIKTQTGTFEETANAMQNLIFPVESAKLVSTCKYAGLHTNAIRGSDLNLDKSGTNIATTLDDI